MLRSLRFASVIGVLSTVFVCLPLAPAQPRPLMQASGSLQAVKLAAPRDFDDIIERRMTGLQLEKQADRERVLTQARRYIAMKRHGGRAEQSEFMATCARASEKSTDKTIERINPFCVVEADFLAEATRERNAKRKVGANFKMVSDAIESSEFEKLSSFTLREIYRSLLHVSDFDGLATPAEKAASAKTCATGPLLVALASRAEDFLPAETAIELARKLYRRAADCGADELSQTARFRYSMLSIWRNKCKEAEPYLASLVSRSEAADLHSRAKYWRYQCAVQTKNEALQKEMRESLWKMHSLTFHNLAINGQDTRMHEVLADQTRPKLAVRSLIRPDLNGSIRAIEALIEIGENEMAARVTELAVERLASTEPEIRLYAAALMSRIGKALPKFKILSSLFLDSPRLMNRATLTLLYPMWFHEQVEAAAKSIDPLLIISLIRQESAFNVNARSPAGARGLMQVMPATARSIASVRRERLYDPRTNIAVGVKYLTHRLERYSGDVELTLAAYNAGFTRVDNWLKRYPVENKVLFMDLIPFSETRGYVSAILRNYFWYTQLYGPEGKVDPSLGAPEKVLAILSANAGAEVRPVQAKLQPREGDMSSMPPSDSSSQSELLQLWTGPRGAGEERW